MIRNITNLIKNSPTTKTLVSQSENQDRSLSIIKSQDMMASKCTKCDFDLMKTVTPNGTTLNYCKNKTCKTFGSFYQLEPTYTKTEINLEWY